MLDRIGFPIKSRFTERSEPGSQRSVSGKNSFSTDAKPKLLKQAISALRSCHYSFMMISCRTFIVLMAITISASLTAQTVELDFDVTDENQLGLFVWNHGIMGNFYSLTDGEILPSCQYRQYPDHPREQVEHFSQAGIWIGGMVNGVQRVSTAIIDGSFNPGDEGFEYLQVSVIERRSSLISSPYYHPDAITHQDFLMEFKDYGAVTDDNFGIPNHNPLGINVQLETYNWNLNYTEGFVILNYTISNVSPDTIDNIYAGIWVDASVANMNYTNIYEPGGGFTWYDNLDGFDQSIDETGFYRNIGYQYDEDGDDGWAESYVGFAVLGGTVPRPYFTTNFNQWVWSNSNNIDYPEYDMALNDYARYEQLSTSVPHGLDDLYTPEGYPNQPSSWLFMVSAGPLGSQPTFGDPSNWVLPPGDSLNVQFATLTAKWNGRSGDDFLRRAKLHMFADRAQMVYHGEDVNRNNVLDVGEDINGDGLLDRYILPSDPPQNLTAIWDYPVVTLIWEPPPQTVVDYNVYKNDTLITYTPISDTFFLVNAVTDSGSSIFYITGVNDWGWESTPSNSVRDFSLPPSVEFTFNSNPLINDLPTDTSFTFPTRTFSWEVQDPDGIESVQNIYYALDDTSYWIELPGYMRSITLEDIPPGFHTFYLKAADDFAQYSPTILFPDPFDSWTANHWKVMQVVGYVLLVDDFAMDSQNDTQNWYRSMMDTLSVVGEGNYSVWEIGEVLPYSFTDIAANLNYFDHVIWYTAYTGTETYDGAASSISSYVMNGGNIFINVVEFKDPPFEWFPIDSVFTLNPSGRLLPGRTLVSQVDPDLNLQTSYTIGVRVKGFETFLGDSLDCPQFRSLYRMQEPEAGDEWAGTPNVCGAYRFQLPYGECSGNVVLMSLPLHNGSQPLLDGNGSAGKFIRYVLEQEFALEIWEELTTQPMEFYLHQNYPNPFNPVTTIQYELPQRSDVQITIYDLLGRKVTTLVSKYQVAGYKSVIWDATNDLGQLVSAGVYFYRIKSGDFVQTKKMVLLR